MIYLDAFLFQLFLQLTVILLLGIFLIRMAGRAVTRHSVGFATLVLVLLSPILVAVLPNHPVAKLLPSSGTAQGPADAKSPVQEAVKLEAFHLEQAAGKGLRDTASESSTTGVAAVRTPDFWEPANFAVDTSSSATVAPSPTTPLPAVVAKGWSWREHISIFAVLVWALGVVGLTAHKIRQMAVLRRICRSNRHFSLSSELADKVRSALGVDKLPPVVVCDANLPPLVRGLRSPTVVLPRRVTENSSADEIRDVLVHEVAHVVRRDQWIHLLQRIAAIIFWPHVLLHWLNHELSQAREEVCDNHVLGQTSAPEYSSVLLQIAEKLQEKTAPAHHMGLFGYRWTLETRVRDLLNPKRDRSTRGRRVTSLAATTCLCLAGFAVGGTGLVSKKLFAQEAKDSEVGIGDKEVAKAEETFSVSGTCRDTETGKPVVGAKLVLLGKDFGPGDPVILGEELSDKSGAFSFSPVAFPDRVCLAARATRYASKVKTLNRMQDLSKVDVKMSSDVATLKGVVTDRDGHPIKGATVFIDYSLNGPVPSCQMDITNASGEYEIRDLRPRLLANNIRYHFAVHHPKYAPARPTHNGIPSTVNVTLDPPAIVRGLVIDKVTGQPMPGIVVSAQGIAGLGWFQTRTDSEGKYRLNVREDHYNIWAEADERIAIAVKAIQALSGKEVLDTTIHMVKGGFVTGTIDPGGDGTDPLPAGMRVAHQGPARPATGGAVLSVNVKPDGQFRMRVAPGRNHVYLMNGNASVNVEIKDGQEKIIALINGRNAPRNANRDLALRNRIMLKARDLELVKRAKEMDRQRIEAGGLPRGSSVQDVLDKLEELGATRDMRYREPWCRALMELVELGPDAVPELTDVLDATSDQHMLRCLGFALRAIGDKRAVPSLIRAIPRTLLASGSDMGLRSEQDDIVKFFQKHDLRSTDRDNRFGVGRPVREVFGALKELTGQSFGEDEIFHVHRDGTEREIFLKGRLFHSVAQRHAEWWNKNSEKFVNDADYQTVNLAPFDVAKAPAVLPAKLDGSVFADGAETGRLLESVLNPRAERVFYDLDTGRYAAVPDSWRTDTSKIVKSLPEIRQWAIKEGFDLMGNRKGETYFIEPLALKAWLLDIRYWHGKFKEMPLSELRSQGKPVKRLVSYDSERQAYDIVAHAPFHYETVDGSLGLLYLGVSVSDDSLQQKLDNAEELPPNEGDDLWPIGFWKGRRFGLEKLKQ